MNPSISNFAKSRVTAVDIQPLFEAGFKTALEFCKSHNIPLGSTDGLRIIHSYVLQNVTEFIKKHKSEYPTALYMSKLKSPKLVHFVTQYMPKLSAAFKLPYCGYIPNASDVETACLKTIDTNAVRSKNKQMVLKSLRLRTQPDPH